MSRLIIVVHVLKVKGAPSPVRFGRVHADLGASSRHQHRECVPPRRHELRRRLVIQVHITVLVVRLVKRSVAPVPVSSAKVNSGATPGARVARARSFPAPVGRMEPRGRRARAGTYVPVHVHMAGWFSLKCSNQSINLPKTYAHPKLRDLKKIHQLYPCIRTVAAQAENTINIL